MSQQHLSSDQSLNPKSNDDDDDNVEYLIDQLADLISKNDVDKITDIQRSLLNQFEKSNQMLVYCNELSNQHYLKLSKDFRSHTTKLNEMYKDLDIIFHRIRMIKQKLKEKYPDITIETPKQRNLDEDESNTVEEIVENSTLENPATTTTTNEEISNDSETNNQCQNNR
ncbi:KxDL motif-containing protein 1 [Dermatophagoides pteronyssinus]|uniref:KxDL motif-containing protein 1 n=1 Tax=Dermatophagoides pteronyssinus TaxID=6956 RepID=A0ABQ8JUY2_DERPT|nr:KxDL motif-containing protein 1 [Dermatophagoides pteronyssinus]